jgi:hypothetical protein
MDFRQTIIAQGPNTDIDITIENIREGINRQLDNELDDTILSPESGIQKIRKVLARFGVDMPALYGTDPEGDEVVVDLTEDENTEKYYLYFIYVLSDDNRYDFYAEIVDEAGLDEIESDEEEDEDTE